MPLKFEEGKKPICLPRLEIEHFYGSTSPSYLYVLKIFSSWRNQNNSAVLSIG